MRTCVRRGLRKKMPLAVRIILIIITIPVGLFFGFALLVAVSSLFVNTKKIYMKHSRYYRTLLNISTHIAMVIMRIKIHTEGLEKIPQGTRFMMVQNHRSKFDPIVSWFILEKYDMAFLSKHENLEIPIFGRIIRKCCYMSINREHPSKAMETVVNAAQLLKDDQVSMGVYPEGTRNTTEEPLLPFHNSIFKIAQMADVPIVVMTAKGTADIKHNYPKKASHVYFNVTGVIPAEELKGKKTHEIADRVRELMLMGI